MAHIPAERCLSIIQLLADSAEEMALGAIAEKLELPKSGTHRLLSTLVEQGWAKQDPHSGFYRLTMRIAILGQRFYVATGLPDICQPILGSLALQSREYVRLAVVDSEALVWVAHAQGATGGLMYQPALESDNVPLHATASGKAWLSTLPTDQAVQIVVNSSAFANPDAYGPNVARSLSRVMEDLQQTADRGYGVVMSEAERGVSAMGTVVRSGQGGPVVGTVSIAGPSVRMVDQRIAELAPTLKAAAEDLSSLWPLRMRPDAQQDHFATRVARSS